MNNSNRNKNNNNKWLSLITIPIQMGVIIFGFAYLGKWMDHRYENTHHIFVKISTLTGIAIAFYNLNRQLKDINKPS